MSDLYEYAASLQTHRRQRVEPDAESSLAGDLALAIPRGVAHTAQSFASLAGFDTGPDPWLGTSSYAGVRMVEGAVQYMPVFGGAFAALKGITTIGKAAVGAGMASDFLSARGNEGRFVDVLAEVIPGLKDLGLTTDPNEGDTIEGRLKNVVDGLGFDFLLGGLAAGMRKAKGAARAGDARRIEKAIDELSGKFSSAETRQLELDLELDGYDPSSGVQRISKEAESFAERLMAEEGSEVMEPRQVFGFAQDLGAQVGRLIVDRPLNPEQAAKKSGGVTKKASELRREGAQAASDLLQIHTDTLKTSKLDRSFVRRFWDFLDTQMSQETRGALEAGYQSARRQFETVYPEGLARLGTDQELAGEYRFRSAKDWATWLIINNERPAMLPGVERAAREGFDRAYAEAEIAWRRVLDAHRHQFGDERVSAALIKLRRGAQEWDYISSNTKAVPVELRREELVIQRNRNIKAFRENILSRMDSVTQDMELRGVDPRSPDFVERVLDKSLRDINLRMYDETFMDAAVLVRSIDKATRQYLERYPGRKIVSDKAMLSKVTNRAAALLGESDGGAALVLSRMRESQIADQRTLEDVFLNLSASSAVLMRLGNELMGKIQTARPKFADPRGHEKELQELMHDYQLYVDALGALRGTKASGGRGFRSLGIKIGNRSLEDSIKQYESLGGMFTQSSTAAAHFFEQIARVHETQIKAMYGSVGTPDPSRPLQQGGGSGGPGGGGSGGFGFGQALPNAMTAEEAAAGLNMLPPGTTPDQAVLEQTLSAVARMSIDTPGKLMSGALTEMFMGNVLSGARTLVGTIPVFSAASASLKMIEMGVGGGMAKMFNLVGVKTLANEAADESVGAAVRFFFDAGNWWRGFRAFKETLVAGENVFRPKATNKFQEIQSYINEDLINRLRASLGHQPVDVRGTTIGLATAKLLNAYGSVVRFPGRWSQAVDAALATKIGYAMAESRMAQLALRKQVPVNEIPKFVAEGVDAVIRQGSLVTQDFLMKEAIAAADKRGIVVGRRQFIDDFVAAGFDKINQIDPSLGALATQIGRVADEGLFSRDLDPQGLSAAVKRLKSRSLLINFAVPFITMPTNALTLALDRSPLALTRGMYQFLMTGPFKRFYPAAGERLKQSYNRILQDMNSSDPVARVELMGRMATAASVMTGVWSLLAEGRITGSPPVDRQERELVASLGGPPPQSILIGDRWISYGKLDPIASVFSMMADAYRYATENGEKEDGFAVNIGLALLVGLTENFTNKSYMQGFEQTLEAVLNPIERGPRYVYSLTRALAVPNLLAQFASAEDPYLRETRGMLDNLKSALPWAREGLAVRRNFLGEPVQSPKLIRDDFIGREPGLAPRFFNAIMPVYSLVTSDHQLNKELLALNHPFSPPGYKWNRVVDLRDIVDAKGRSVYDVYAERVGTVRLGGLTVRERLTRLINSREYQTAVDFSTDTVRSPRIEMIQRELERYRAAAKREVIRTNSQLQGILREQTQQLKSARLGTLLNR